MKITIRNSKSVSVSKAILVDGTISPAAKGIFAFLLAIKPGHELSKKEIRQFNKIGEAGLNAAMQELKDAGYLIEAGREYVLDNGDGSTLVPKTRIKAIPKASKTKEEWVEQRAKEQQQFIQAVQYTFKSMTDPKPGVELLRRFVEYWATPDTLDPSKPMLFQQKSPFNIKSRIRTFMVLDAKRKAQTKNSDRL